MKRFRFRVGLREGPAFMALASLAVFMLMWFAMIFAMLHVYLGYVAS